jgi:aarF domain-containing kinase
MTQLVLLDHGLYRVLNDRLRYGYSLLWKGILNQSEDDIKKACKIFGVTNHFMFAAMVTSKDWNDIMDKKKVDNKERLTVRLHDKETKTEAATKAKLYMNLILQSLRELDNDLLIILKVNDYLRAIDNRLGYPANSYLHVVTSI